MMKRIIVILFYFCFIINLFSQREERNMIGLTFSTLLNDKLLGEPSSSVWAYSQINNSAAVGVTYLHQLNSLFDLETGVELMVYQMELGSVSIPNFSNTNISETRLMINLPLTARYYFLNYLFANGGLLLDVDWSKNKEISNQSGIGIMGGLGFNYDFKFGGSVFVNPYVKLHSLIPFGSWENHQHVLDAGVRVGVMYRL